MADEPRNFSSYGGTGNQNDVPPLTPLPPPSAEELERMKQQERRELAEDIKLGAVASGAVGLPGIGMGVADLLDRMRKPNLEVDIGKKSAAHFGDDEHRDPISGETGAHPVGVGVGAATGGAAAGAFGGMAIGSIAGPAGTALGAAVGAAVGAFAGGLAGKGIAESIHPTILDVKKHEVENEEDPDDQDDYKSAHAFGWNSRLEYADETWDAAEDHLRAEWESDSEFHKHRSWSEVKHCVKESWDQADSTRHI